MAFFLDGEHDDGSMADINVTPLVDVMLVLLIIFMITAPMLHQGVDVDLPEMQSPEEIERKVDDPMVLSIRTDGLVYLRDKPVHPTKLVETLQPLLANRDDSQVFLKGDKSISYGQFMEVVGILYGGGIRNIGLVAEEITGAGR